MRSVAELLTDRVFPDLAKAVRASIDPVTLAWEQRVRQAIPSANRLNFEQLRNHLPISLGRLADVLASSNPDESSQLLPAPGEHGIARFDQDFKVEELIAEYRILRQIMVREVWQALERAATDEESMALHAGIDALLQESVVAFVQHQKQQIEAATAGEAKFLSFVSHDLRNNLNSVTLTLALLRKRLEGVPEFEEDVVDLDTTRHNITETISAMERLLQAERLRRKPQIRVGNVDIGALAGELIRRLTPQVQKNGLQIKAEIPPGAALRTDREWLAMVLQNLLGNAVKFSEHGTVGLSAAPRAEGGWRIAVSDQGPGIAPEDLGRIFTAFERGQARGQKGVGLGLVIASQATRLLGGDISVESEVGLGTTFRVDLPANPPAATATPPAQAAVNP